MKEGIFWVIARNKQALINGKFELITHFVRDEPHRDFWNIFRQTRMDISRFEYDYFPRGRIWLKDNTATVFVNPILITPAVIEKVKDAFELTDDMQVYGDDSVPIQKL